jgi:D-amino acid aminotransferase
VPYVFLNGRIIPEEEATVPVTDRALLLGDAAYETMRSYSGRFFRFPEHLRRLHHSLEGMCLALGMPDEIITRGALDLIQANGIPEARLRLTVTGGVHRGTIRLRRSGAPNVILSAEFLVPPPEAFYREGVAVLISPWRVHSDSPLPRIKTVNRLMHLMAKEAALEQGAYESLFLDEANGVLEGTATNIFFVIDGALRTAPLSGPLLAGVTRDAVLEVAREAGMAVREERVGVEEIARATEAFLTSTTIELLPVRAIEGRAVGDGRPGDVWRALHRAYRTRVSEETGVTLDPLPV